MASEIRVDKINSLSGVGTVTLSPTGVDIAGITTAATLRATTGIVTSLTAGSLTSLGAVSGTTGTFTSTVKSGTTATGVIFSAGDSGNSGDRVIQFKRAATTNDINIQAINSGSGGTNLLFNQEGGAASFGGALSATSGTFSSTGSFAGNVNIGANSSSNPFTYLRFGASQYGAADIRPTNDASHKVGLSFYVDGTQDTTINPTEALRITSAGLVGIATATPRAQFDVIKATGNVIALFEGSNASQNHRVRIDASGASSTSALSISNSNSNNQTSMYHSGGNNNMVIMGGQTAGAEPTAGTAVATFASGGDVTVNTGNLVIGTAGKGIDFSATGDGSGTMTNELLDDYEEGTWTILVSPGGGSYSVSHMNARYVRIGNIVTVQGWWRAAGISGVSGSLTISGLPYATLDYSSGGGVRQSLNLHVAHVNYSGLTFVKFRIGNNSTQGSILGNTAGASGGSQTWTAGNIALSSELYISGSYITG